MLYDRNDCARGAAVERVIEIVARRDALRGARSDLRSAQTDRQRGRVRPIRGVRRSTGVFRAGKSLSEVPHGY